MGPRGLSILERMVELLHASPLPLDIKVDIVEPGECGQGSHPAHQPDHLLTNTVASQVSIFAQDSMVAGKDGISLTQWARMVGYRRFGTRYFPVKDGSGEEITDHDHLPRNMLGEYLTWAFDRIVRLLPENVRIEHHRRRVVDLIALKSGGFTVCLDNGFQYPADHVFITTGHGTRAASPADLAFDAFARSTGAKNPKLNFYSTPYPVHCLNTIAADATVAVQGLGLTAYDVISALTTGRGGQFVEEQGKFVYRPSGREPNILLFSRNCLPFAARGANQKGIAGRHQARFFTVDAVKALQARAVARTGSHQLDFAEEMLPLIEKEMAYVYRAVGTGSDPAPASFQATAEERQAISKLLNPLKGKTFSSFESFRRFFRAQVEADLAEAHKGNLTSPVKAATDVLRDTREALRTGVEFAGLTPSSHKVYVEDFVATTNRISFGPPRRRNAELLALMDAGVLDVAGGPGNQVTTDAARGQFCIANQFGKEQVRHYADVLVIARLDPYSPRTDSSALTTNLVRRELVRPHLNGDYHPGGLDINRDMQVIDASGESHGNLWAIGFPVEGPHFYTHALPRPLMNSRFTQDAHRCVAQLLESLRERQQASRQEDRLAAFS
ncbi:MAG: FAD/NAD(P)-binding protein [Ramlibacter sp.]|nr:FAD/NAD(P)-binding protein [Ramlibacter sp.]